MCIQIQILGVQGVQIPGEPKKKQNMLQSEQSDFEKGLINFYMCSIFIGKVLHFIVFYLDYIQNPTIVQFDTLCVSLFHLPVF